MSTEFSKCQIKLKLEHIKTTAEVYMDQIPDSVRKAIDARTDAIFSLRKMTTKTKSSGVLHNLARQRKSKVSVK